jgi:alkanesulfonate monooxygenase SsuD/methylene tetrahydromethanopterin reductase-like flavin-dependent oxidoreductase (luciferase family)
VLGYDTLFAADHLGSYAPFQMVVAAAQATSRIRLGTLVLNVPFWNPALLAREIATADILTDGRLEVGLGSGHMKWEFDAAGIPWEGFGARAERLEQAIEDGGRDRRPDRAKPGTVRIHLLHGARPVRRGIRSGHRAVPRFVAPASPSNPTPSTSRIKGR